METVEQLEQGQTRKLKRPGTPRRQIPRKTEPSALGGGDIEVNQTVHDPELVSNMAAWAEETEKAERGAKIPATTKPLVASEPMIHSSKDLEMEDVDSEGEYVYDTYARHYVSSNSATALAATANIGHIISTLR